MQFEMPMATQAMNNKIAAADPDGECWEVIGAPLDQGVDRTLVDYDNKLELKLAPKPSAKRQEVSDLRWGKIDKDAARLEGLAAAVENISAVVKKGKEQLAHEWKGKSFDAFRAAIDKVEQTLNDYAKATKTTSQGFRDALNGIRILYGRYRDTSTGIFKFDGMQPPNEWWKMSEDSGEFLAERCTSSHFAECTYNNDEQQGIIKDKFVNNKLFNQLERWDCTDNPGVTVNQYRDTVRWAEDEKKAIEKQIHEWYDTTDGLKKKVSELYDASLDNLRIMSELKVFQSMQTPAAPAGGKGDDSKGGDDTGGGGGGGGHNGGGGGSSGGGPGSTGGGPGSTGSAGASTPEPTQPPEPTQTPEPTPSQTDPQGQSETVTIEEGDRKISVTSPDGQGNVKVTIDDGTGKPKTYDLNFGDGTDPASTPGTPGTPGQDPVRTLPYPADGSGSTGGSGTGQQQPGQQEPGTPGADGEADDGSTPIQPGADGKCVISDPPTTITAERPPGTTDKVVVTIDDGTGKPTTYTLDYSDDATGGQATPIAQPQRAGTPDADPRAVPGADQAFGPAGEYRMPISGDLATGADTGSVPAGAPEPAARPGFTVAEPMPGDLPGPPVADPALTTAQGNLSGDAPASGFGGTASGGQAGSFGLPDGSPYTDVPAQTTPGEAGLASASDSGAGSHQGQGGGMAGGGMPMMAGAGGGAGGGDTDRAGSQWRTSGDLFDDAYAEPAGRFGGVLDSDDAGPRR